MNSSFCQTIAGPLENTVPKPKPPLTKSELYQLRIDKDERTIKWADSLIDAGKTEVRDAEYDIDMLLDDRSILERQYNRNRRLAEKEASSGDKEKAKKANEELKQIDAKYKADIKNIDTQIKENLKKDDIGQKNQAIGKEKKKIAQEELKKSQKALDEWLKKINK